MMYQLFDSYKEMMQPVNYLSKSLCHSTLLNNGKIKNWKTIRHMRASAELLERVTRRYGKPGFNLKTTQIKGRKVEVAEEVVMSKSFCDLIHFKRKGREKDPNILLAAPMAGHYASLTRETIRQFLPDYNVYVTDWKNARDLPVEEGEFGFEDFVEYVVEFSRFIGPGNTLMSLCQPCPAALVAATVLAMEDDPAQPASLVLMAGPVDPRINQSQTLKAATDNLSSGIIEKLTLDKVPAQYKGRNRRVYAGYRQLSFFMSFNIPLHLKKHIEFYKNILDGDEVKADKHRFFYDDYSAMIDGDALFYMDTMERVFKEFHLPRGIMKYKGKTIDTGAIKKTALMTVEGGKDTFCPPGQTEAAHALCRNIPSDKKAHYLQEDVGHYGVFSGSKYKETIAPRIKAFITKHDPSSKINPKKAATVPKHSVAKKSSAPAKKATVAKKSSAPAKKATAAKKSSAPAKKATAAKKSSTPAKKATAVTKKASTTVKTSAAKTKRSSTTAPKKSPSTAKKAPVTTKPKAPKQVKKGS